MKLLIIINTSDAETAWNSLRLGTTALDAGHQVSIFLLGSGVEIQNIQDKNFDVAAGLNNFLKARGEIFACGTCLKLRDQDAGLCPVSTMSQLVQLIAGADRVVTFG